MNRKVSIRETRGRKPVTYPGVFGKIGERIRDARKQRGMSVQQAADATGNIICVDQWYSFERGQAEAKVIQFLAMSMAIGVPAHRLLGNEIARVVLRVRVPMEAEEIVRLLQTTGVENGHKGN